MEQATHICTHCGYEGRPVKPPSDEAYEGQSDFSKGIARVANLLFPGLGLIIRPLAMFLMLPITILLWLLKRASSGKKHCPNCGLPLMVKLTSDAGYVAKRRQELKAGLLEIPEEKKEKVAFGREIALPGDEEKNKKPTPKPMPTKLGTLEELLREPEAPVTETEEKQWALEEKPKKPVDPDQW